MLRHRIIVISAMMLLQVAIGCHKRTISVSPLAYPFAGPGDYLEFKKATPGIPDFVVVFSAPSPCGSVTTVSVNGTKPGGCKVVAPPAGSVPSSSAYTIYLNSPDRTVAPAIARPSSWPRDIPFNVVPCGVCGSEVNLPGSSASGQQSSVAQQGSSDKEVRENTVQVKVGMTAATSYKGQISCQAGVASVDPVTASITTDHIALWSESGPNQGWAITKFYPKSPCSDANSLPTSNNPVCFLSPNSANPYTFDITVNSCATQLPSQGGQLTVTP
jgi:hypothetical protein